MTWCCECGPLCGEITGHLWIPRTKARDAEFWFFYLRQNKRLSKQSRRRLFETPSCSLWRHCNGKCMWSYRQEWAQSCWFRERRVMSCRPRNALRVIDNGLLPVPCQLISPTQASLSTIKCSKTIFYENYPYFQIFIRYNVIKFIVCDFVAILTETEMTSSLFSCHWL